jgi:predicted RNA-binding Zn ribbon-like protein
MIHARPILDKQGMTGVRPDDGPCANQGALHRRRLVWTDTSLAAALARRLVEELSALDPDRLRRCARPECDLLFYDTTRSRTRRGHVEDSCGWRERQRVHRTRRATATRAGQGRGAHRLGFRLRER